MKKKKDIKDIYICIYFVAGDECQNFEIQKVVFYFWEQIGHTGTHLTLI